MIFSIIAVKSRTLGCVTVGVSFYLIALIILNLPISPCALILRFLNKWTVNCVYKRDLLVSKWSVSNPRHIPVNKYFRLSFLNVQITFVFQKRYAVEMKKQVSYVICGFNIYLARYRSKSVYIDIHIKVKSTLLRIPVMA